MKPYLTLKLKSLEYKSCLVANFKDWTLLTHFNDSINLDLKNIESISYMCHLCHPAFRVNPLLYLKCLDLLKSNYPEKKVGKGHKVKNIEYYKIRNPQIIA